MCYSANPYIEQIKSRPWTDLPALLGKIGDVILSDLLVDCAIFAPLVTEVGSLYQLSGEFGTLTISSTLSFSRHATQ